MELEGVVTNIVAFGAFVDVGVHQDGLVHVSQLADRYVSDPNQVVSVGQRVKVRVLERGPPAQPHRADDEEGGERRRAPGARQARREAGRRRRAPRRRSAARRSRSPCPSPAPSHRTGCASAEHCRTRARRRAPYSSWLRSSFSSSMSVLVPNQRTTWPALVTLREGARDVPAIASVGAAQAELHLVRLAGRERVRPSLRRPAGGRRGG